MESAEYEETPSINQKKPLANKKAANKSSGEATLSNIKGLIQVKASEGKTDLIIELLKEHGAQNASSLSEDNYESFYNELSNL